MGEQRQTGFTLIELSIVLVIIGLIVGGVLVGSDLILMARVKKTISLVQEYTQAVNAFQTKYNCLPGDCPNASAFGLGGKNGNGNGLILDYAAVASFSPIIPDEIAYANVHLYNAGFLPGKTVNYWYGSGVAVDFDGYGMFVLATDANTYIPTLYLGLMPYTNNWTNPCPNNTNVFYGGYLCPGVNAYVASLIDTKIDDGLPNSGSVYEHGTQTYLVYPGVLWAGAPGSNANVCQNNTVTPAVYNIANNNTRTCVLGFRMR